MPADRENTPVPRTATDQAPVPAAMPTAKAAKTKTMSQGSRRLVLKRIRASVPTMPMPLPRLSPMASISMAEMGPATTSVWTMLRL